MSEKAKNRKSAKKSAKESENDGEMELVNDSSSNADDFEVLDGKKEEIEETGTEVVQGTEHENKGSNRYANDENDNINDENEGN